MTDEQEATVIEDDLGPPRWVWKWLVVFACVVALAVASVVVVVGLSSIRHLDRQDCSDELEGAAWKALGDALEAPPGAPERDEAVRRLIEAARHVGDTGNLCS